MTDHKHPAEMPADISLIIEQLQDQLDDLATTVRTQQDQIAHQAARISALERPDRS